MTLLIGTIARSDNPSKSHVVMTADGRCTGFDGRTRTIQSDTHQKLFAIPNTALAIAHHGENIIGGRPVKEFLAAFMLQNPLICEASAVQISDSLKKYTDEVAQNTLRSIPASKVIGFWIAGFGRNRSHPELVEICWTKDVSSGTITLEEKGDRNLAFILGGDAQEFVRQYHEKPIDGMYDWKQIPHESSNYAIKFHAKLYGLAESAQSQKREQLFGGKKHQLVITRGGSHWTMPPHQTSDA